MRGRFPLFWVLFTPLAAVGLGASAITFFGYLGQRQALARAIAMKTALNHRDHVVKELTAQRQALVQAVAWQQERLQQVGVEEEAALQRGFVASLRLFPEVDGLAWANERGDFFHLHRLGTGRLAWRRRQLPDRRLYRYEGDGATFVLKETRTDFDPHRDPPANPWYAAVKARGALWRTVVSRARGQSQPELVLVWLAPVHDRAGRFRGVASAALNRDRMSQALAADRPSPGSRLFVVDASGQLVATSTREALSKTFAAENVPWPPLAIASTDPVVAAIAAQLDRGLQSGTPDWRWQGQSYTLHLQDLPEGERLVVAVPHADFYDLGGEVGWALRRSLLLLLGTAVVGGAVAWYLRRSLHHIEQAIAGFAQNQFAPALPPNPIAECQVLSERIQAIGQDLAAASRLYQHYTTELEAAIAERTQQWQAAERFLADLVNRLPGIVRVEDAHTQALRFVNTAHPKLADAQALACTPKEAEALRQGLTLETETMLGDRPGEERWWWVRRQLLRDAAGNPEFFLTIAEDITLRRRLEAARQDRETQFRHLVENIPSAIFRYELSPEGQDRVTYISPRIWDICEISPQAILDDVGSWWQLVPEEETSALRAAIADSAARLTPLHRELWINLPSGQQKWVEIVAIPALGDRGTVFWDGLLTDITDRRRSEQALRDSEERYRTLAEWLPVGVFRNDAQGQTIYCNQALQALVGATAADLTADRWLQFVDPRDREAEAAGWQTFVQEAQQGRTAPREVEYRYGTAAGHVGWVYVRTVPERDRDGNLVGFLGSVLDITARKNLSDALEQELALRRAIEGALIEGLVVFDQGGRQTYVSDVFCRRVGWAREELVGLGPPYPYCPPETAAQIQAMIQQGEGTRRGVELTLQHRNGIPFPVWMVFAPIHDERGQVTAWLASCFDLTALQTLEREREEARDRYRLLFESINDGFAVLEVIFDNRNQPIDVYFWEANPACERLMGVGAVVGHRASAKFPEEDLADCEWIQACGQVQQTGQGLRLEGELWGHELEAEIFPVGSTAVPQVGILARDIGDRKRWEAAQLQAKEAAEAASRAKTELLAKVTHDLRTPLNAMLGFSELLMGEPNLTETQRSWLQTMTQSGRYLLQLISDMLETAKLRAGKATVRLEIFPLRTCLEGAIAMVSPMAAAKGLMLVAEIDPQLPPYVESDRQKLTQILMNLLSNAVKFTSEGCIVLRAAVSQDGLHLEVEDTGIGIPENQLAQIFEAFAQADNTQGEGTGLGLAIVHQYVQLLGGTLTVTSQPGQGSTFRLNLPIRIPPSPNRATPTVTKPWLRLLVAEDNPVNQQVMATMLERLGYRATFVRNGREALERLQQQTYDLVLMDVDMPVMDGITATQEIYQRLPFDRQPPIVGVTALIEKREQCLRAGMFEVLAKPLRLEPLAQALQQCSPHQPLPDPDLVASVQV